MKPSREYILIVPLELLCEIFEEDFISGCWDFFHDGVVLVRDPPKDGRRRGKLLRTHEIHKTLDLDKSVYLISAYWEHARRSLALIVEHPDAPISNPGDIRPDMTLFPGTCGKYSCEPRQRP